MPTAGVRQLKNDLSRYLRELKPGESVTITDRGRVVAELRSALPERTGASSLTGGYARLLAAGVIRPAIERGDPLGNLRADRASAAPRGTVAALIGEDRGD
jgi:antitoxin (DNA-binding transcriptional repressor) of toxin-antitoxin stability system